MESDRAGMALDFHPIRSAPHGTRLNKRWAQMMSRATCRGAALRSIKLRTT